MAAGSTLCFPHPRKRDRPVRVSAHGPPLLPPLLPQRPTSWSEGDKMSKSLGPTSYTLDDPGGGAKLPAPPPFRYTLIGRAAPPAAHTFTFDGLYASQSAPGPSSSAYRRSPSWRARGESRRISQTMWRRKRPQRTFGPPGQSRERPPEQPKHRRLPRAPSSAWSASNPAPALAPEDARALLRAFSAPFYALGDRASSRAKLKPPTPRSDPKRSPKNAGRPSQAKDFAKAGRPPRRTLGKGLGGQGRHRTDTSGAEVDRIASDEMP